MDLDEARDYLRTHHHAVLATMRRDGTPQMSPVACTVDDGGRVVVSSRETAIKVKNVRRDPRAWSRCTGQLRAAARRLSCSCTIARA